MQPLLPTTDVTAMPCVDLSNRAMESLQLVHHLLLRKTPRLSLAPFFGYLSLTILQGKATRLGFDVGDFLGWKHGMFDMSCRSSPVPVLTCLLGGLRLVYYVRIVYE
ncbi:unnamed protein product [Periconia digitata]|uniref:Uncharacterized protein n=1 Tax=Periconia digitata TaxID=1303443 RepID=A0A9W4UEF3_9PLEO|nr:unnamed protein product [Periconia digitata]